MESFALPIIEWCYNRYIKYNKTYHFSRKILQIMYLIDFLI